MFVDYWCKNQCGQSIGWYWPNDKEEQAKPVWAKECQAWQEEHDCSPEGYEKWREEVRMRARRFDEQI